MPIFTHLAAPKNLKNTALFIGGSDVIAGELLLAEALKHMMPQFGLRVSVLLDASGANTTAAAAVQMRPAATSRWPRRAPLVLGGTGPVGRASRLLLAQQGTPMRAWPPASRCTAAAVCDSLRDRIPNANVDPAGVTNTAEATSRLARENTGHRRGSGRSCATTSDGACSVSHAARCH